MGQSFQDLLDEFHAARTYRYSDDPTRVDAMMEVMERTMQTILEKLRDKLDPS